MLSDQQEDSQRPGTCENMIRDSVGGSRIFERQFYITQNESSFQTSPKVFSNIKTDPEGTGPSRPSLNSYKREFSMPNHFHVEIPKMKISTAGHLRNKTTLDLTMKSEQLATGQNQPTIDYLEDGFVNQDGAKCTDSLLSKHNGWITIDG